ncbi:transcription initiation factor TFIID subunit 4 isoform X2 [Neocloeon triangulifer]|uniref:transcription initiation factor TFIID subunit 4 isoform X2 n=1 Tax=Neocloeon triangulifer TaxID=2078957 RepID=UPI00286EE6B5|nr:transcription initiation factor TFIID subunit 4 isoform X2 [Neocloeon triangulifer]
MASAKFLEEALNNDVDESAVNAIVGSLETQLGSAGAVGGGAPTPGPTVAVPGAVATAQLNGPAKHNGAPDINNGEPARPLKTEPPTVNGIVTPPTPVATPAPAKPPPVISNGATKTVPPPPALVPAAAPTMQILNVNPIRAAAPNAAPGINPGVMQKGVPQRVVIGTQQMVGARPGQPGQITLQAIPGLQPGAQGHILVKTENGQLQLLRVGSIGPATTNAQGTLTQAGAPGATTTYRLQSVPVSAAPRPGAPMQQVATAPQGVRLVTAGTNLAGGVAVTQGIVQPQQQTAAQLAQKQAVDSTKEKCRKFLANLLELSSREPRQVERNVRTLIQELIDTKVEPEEFCDRLEKLLNASPQPCLIGFLKKSLPLLRQALITKELVIDGIRPPPMTVVYQLPQGGLVMPTTLQARGPGTQGQQIRLQAAPTQLTTQVRVMAPMNAAGVRAPMQHRLVTPTRPMVPGKMASPITVVRGQVPSAATTTIKTMPALSKEKEKKTFSSSGYAGDDDINDVAAMGGVNLAEESQRILGSTEFVGTQIRSVKDELFLHAGPLHQRIKQILAKHGLDDPPNSEVAALISHATQERLRELVEKLAVISEHRQDMLKLESHYEPTQDVRAQLRFLEDLDRMERRRHDEQERELLLRAAKSRSKTEDPEQAKLKAKAKEMQRAEMEELRQREANLTALQAIGPRKKPKLDLNGASSSSGQSTTAGASGSSSSTTKATMPLRSRVKRVTMKDILFLLEQEKTTCRSPFLYKAYLK